MSGASGAMYLYVLTTGNVYGLYPGLGGTYFSFGNNRTGGNTVSDTATTTAVSQF